MSYVIAESIAKKNGIQLSENEVRSLPTFSFSLNAINLQSSNINDINNVISDLETAKKRLLSSYRKYEYDCMSIAYGLYLLATIRKDSKIQEEKLFAVMQFGEKFGIEGILNKCVTQYSLSSVEEKPKWAKVGETYSRIAFEVCLATEDTLLTHAEENLMFAWTHTIEK